MRHLIDEKPVVRGDEKLSPTIGFLLVFFALAAATLNIRIGSVTVFVYLAVCGLIILLRPLRVTVLILRGWPLALFPLLALTSLLWSDAPGLTARFSVLYMLTLLCGLLLAGSVPSRALARGFAYAFLAYSLYSMLFFGYNPSTPYAFLGAAASKNISAFMSALTMISCMALFLTPGPVIERMLALGGAIIGGVLLLAAQSAGTTAAALFGLFVLVGLSVLGKFSRPLSLAVMGLTGAFVLATVQLLGDRFMRFVETFIVHSMGKDLTLTGRTDIWSKAHTLIERRPMLGQGYQSFWRFGNLDAESLWAEFYIKNRSGFNFHNTLLEIQVGLGRIGLALFLALFLVCLLYAARAYVRQEGAVEKMFMGFMGLIMVRMTVETMMIMPNDLSSLLFAMVFGYGLVGQGAASSRTTQRAPLARTALLSDRRAPDLQRFRV